MRRRMGRAGARRAGARWLRREGGLSLVEIVVGLAILVIALGGIYAVVTQAIRSFGVSEDFLEVQQNARVGLGPRGGPPPPPGPVAWPPPASRCRFRRTIPCAILRPAIR